jgi:stress-induced morphogen
VSVGGHGDLSFLRLEQSWILLDDTSLSGIMTKVSGIGKVECNFARQAATSFYTHLRKSMDQVTLSSKLLESFPDAKIVCRDLTGGGDHWAVEIQSDQFLGKSLVEQHQMVYRALGEWMKIEIHALALQTSALNSP